MEEAFVVHYSNRVKFLVVVAPPVLLALFGLLASLALGTWQESVVISVVFGLLACWFLYISVLSVIAVRYVGIRIRVHGAGLDVRSGPDTQHLPWGQIGSVRRDSIHQALWVRDREGRRVFLVDYWIGGFQNLDAALRQHCNPNA